MNREFNSTTRLQQECILFTRYLINCIPNSYVQKKYIKGHKTSEIYGNTNAFDFYLILAARKNTFLIRLADTYTSFFYRKAALRKKIILLLAILECCSPTFSYFDSIDQTSRPLFYFSLIGRTMGFLITLFLSATVFIPLHTICLFRSNPLNTSE